METASSVSKDVQWLSRIKRNLSLIIRPKNVNQDSDWYNKKCAGA